ncbi:MAG: septation regulator SpoVG [Candidatus Bipolaricaulia bacterium]
MEITKVEIRPMKSEGNLKAFCSVVFDDVFVVHSVKVIQGKRRLFVAMPSREVGDGEFRDIAHPINNEFRMKLEKVILDRYHEEIEQKGEGEELLTEDVTL